MQAPSEPHLVFIVGQERFGVPASAAAEVVSLPALVAVPGSPPHVNGVLAHRGEVVAVVDVQRLRGIGQSGSTRAVWVRSGAGSLAFAADRIEGVETLSGTGEALSGDGCAKHFLGPFEGKSGPVHVIDADGLMGFLSRTSR
ncbi:MAG: chemotaxis protein CheW [Myxococcaceae bacterium]